jgi:hypothetical protein
MKQIKKLIIIFWISLISMGLGAVAIAEPTGEGIKDEIRESIRSYAEIKQSRGEQITHEDIITITLELSKKRFDPNTFSTFIALMIAAVSIISAMFGLAYKLVFCKTLPDEILRKSGYLIDLATNFSKNIDELKDKFELINEEFKKVSNQIGGDKSRNADKFKDIESNIINIMENIKILKDYVEKDDIRTSDIQKEIKSIMSDINTITDEILELIKSY